jgi:uncharacterized membrane protein
MAQKLMVLGLLIILAGFALVFAGASTTGTTSAGGVVFIGPLPIAFGAGPEGWKLALGSVVVGAVMIILLIFWFRGVRESRQV